MEGWEFDLGYHARTLDDAERSAITLKGAEGKRLPNGGLISSPA